MDIWIETYVVEIDVDAPIVGEYKITDSVCPLDGLGIVVKSVEKPGILGFYEFSRFHIGP